VRLFTRSGPASVRPWEACGRHRPRSDGEAVWCDGQGLSIFDKLHSRACDAEVILSSVPSTSWNSTVRTGAGAVIPIERPRFARIEQ
jgi:hypothetical protein